MRQFLLFLIALSSPSYLYAQSGDALTDAINVVRAGYGLRALVYDGNLAWAARNNAAGGGHQVIPPGCRQNYAWNFADVSAVVRAWLASPGHASALLDATITTSGGALDAGRNWTWNGGHGAPQVQVASAPPLSQPRTQPLAQPLPRLAQPAQPSCQSASCPSPIKMMPQAQPPIPVKAMPQASVVVPSFQAPVSQQFSGQPVYYRHCYRGYYGGGSGYRFRLRFHFRPFAWFRGLGGCCS